ncbi:MAG: hypothetical protein ACE5HD_12775 [Acidobacteriota bacterium]
MTYYNDLNQGGALIDSAPETLTLGELAWELIDGAQGGIIMVHKLITDIQGLTLTSHYEDNDTTPVQQCTGDPWAYGSSGPRIASAIPCTGPVTCPQAYQSLTTLRTIYYEVPGVTVADASKRSLRWNTPLSITTAPWPPPSPLSVPSSASEGVPLTVTLNRNDPAKIDLAWGASCGGGVAIGYAVYEGILGRYDSHQPLNCLV